MAQAGMHAMVGMLTRKVAGKKDWLLLGVLLGSFIPDMDNLGVAVATVAKMPTEGIHRTLTHSVLFAALLIALFFLLAQVKKDARWGNLGLGLATGILLHSLLDLLLWFNGVALFWPFPVWVNLWANVTPPGWFMKFMDPAEFLFLGFYLWALAGWARTAGTDSGFRKTLNMWMILEFVLFVIFTPLAYIMAKGFLTIFGAIYLFSLFMAFFVTLLMRQTIASAQ